LERLKEANYAYYKVYALGEWGVTGKIVYETTFDIPKDVDFSKMQLRLGIDYGGINDPNTFTVSMYDKANKHIYLVDAIEHIGMDFEPFAELVIDMMDKYGIRKGHTILTDTSDSRADKILLQYGLSVKHAHKGPGSKLMQLKWMLSHKIHYDYNNKALKRSFETYQWKYNANRDEYLNETDHTGSDILDAFRYSFTNDMKTGSVRSGNFR